MRAAQTHVFLINSSYKTLLIQEFKRKVVIFFIRLVLLELNVVQII